MCEGAAADLLSLSVRLVALAVQHNKIGSNTFWMFIGLIVAGMGFDACAAHAVVWLLDNSCSANDQPILC